ncbi:hypothetical protein [Selenomonas bovis]|uniref:hypothetical protein n=1 Tax=Selenomonas bovis TaxID=416586 RepID=UPI0004E17535|nr:hypothetical protein [Selenomonas bovis]
MGMRQEAIEKVKKDSFEHGSPQEVLQRLLLAWIEYDEDAAERILTENKDTKGCYEHIQSCARGLHQNSVNAAPEQEVKWMLDYYGIKDEEADTLIEGGLMCSIFDALAAQFRPHGMENPHPAAGTTSSEPPDKQKQDAVASLDLDTLLG